MQNALNRLRDLWQNTSRANQTLLIAIAGIASLVGVGFLYWASTPDYQSLVTNASPANAGKITAMLDQRKVNYRIVNEGTIQVPASEAPKLRMAMANEGLLETGSLGYGVLEKSGFGTTQAIEQENIRRAHEGEMEKSIQSLDPVSTARVHLADGSQEPFVDPEKKEASASIIVHLKPGHELNKENVSAIVSLVQSGYTDLSRKNVNLVDGEGHLLFNGAEMAEGLSGADDRQSLERRYATDLTALIRQQLMPLGQDRFQVAVRVKLNLDKETEKSRTSTQGPKVSSDTFEENVQGAGLNVSRPLPGVASNTNGGAAAPPVTGGTTTYEAKSGSDGPGGKYTGTTSHTTYAPGVTEKVIQKATGETKQVAVSVLLDADKVTAEQATTIQNQVSNIVGTQDGLAANGAGNSATVRVDRFKFDNSAVVKEKQEQETAAAAERTNRVMGYVVPFALMFAMLIILARSLRRHTPKPAAAGSSALLGGMGGMGSGMGGLQPALAGAGYSGAGYSSGGLNVLVGANDSTDALALAGMNVEDAMNVDDEGKIIPIRAGEQIHTYEVITEQFDANLESILHLSRSKPEMVARLVKSWIIEEPIRK